MSLKINKYLALAILLISTYSMVSAQGKFDFDKIEHDFGEVSEGNIASHEFTFTNKGSAPIIIQNVRASCGCTTPYWTREPVLPGQEGKIKASYNSKGRPGVFNKTITITSNADEPSKRLTIKGNVIRKPVQPKYSTEELAASPAIGFDNDFFNLGKVEVGQSVVKKLIIENSGKSELKLKDLQSSCNCVTVLSAPESIKPGETAEMEVNITPRVKTKRDEKIYIFSNDLNKPKTELTFTIEVVEDLTGTSIMHKPDNSNPFK
ncbi:MAG: DUF1573 domain-containing protein [Cytophagales bacterium]